MEDYIIKYNGRFSQSEYIEKRLIDIAKTYLGLMYIDNICNKNDIDEKEKEILQQMIRIQLGFNSFQEYYMNCLKK